MVNLLFDLLLAVGDLNSQVLFLYFFRFMASTEGLVPITRAYLSTYYDKYPFVPLSDDVTNLSAKIRSIITDLQTYSSLTEGLNIFIDFSSSNFYVFELMRITIQWNRSQIVFLVSRYLKSIFTLLIMLFFAICHLVF